MAKGRFPLSPEAFGNKWLGRVTRFGEMTAAEFDELRGASLSDRIGPDAVIMYLETEDVQNPEQGRATFFTLDTRPVSKWARFITSLKENCDLVLRDYNDLVGKVLWFQEREEEMGRLGRQRVLEVTGIPSPDEIASLTEVAKLAEEPKEDKGDEYLKELILGVADGLTRAELVKELAEMGVEASEGKVKSLSNSLVAEGKLVFRAGKFALPR